MSSTTNCRATTKSDEPCPLPPMKGEEWCFTHHPDLEEERTEARKLGGKNRRAPSTATEAEAEELTLDDMDDVLRVVQLAIADTLMQNNSTSRNRTLGYLARVALEALTKTELEERIADLEEHVHGEPWR